jgi:hypothetical protein
MKSEELQAVEETITKMYKMGDKLTKVAHKDNNLDQAALSVNLIANAMLLKFCLSFSRKLAEIELRLSQIENTGE